MSGSGQDSEPGPVWALAWAQALVLVLVPEPEQVSARVTELGQATVRGSAKGPGQGSEQVLG